MYSSELFHLSISNGELFASGTNLRWVCVSEKSMREESRFRDLCQWRLLVPISISFHCFHRTVPSSYNRTTHCTRDVIEMVGPGHTTGLVKRDETSVIQSSSFLAAKEVGVVGCSRLQRTRKRLKVNVSGRRAK